MTDSERLQAIQKALAAAGAALAQLVDVPAPAPAPAPAPPAIRYGFNLGGGSYYDGLGLSINWLMQSAVTGATNADGYPLGDIGMLATYVIAQNNAYEWWPYKPGTYVAHGIGTGHKIELSGDKLAAQSFVTVAGQPFALSITLPPMMAPAGDEALQFVRKQYLKLVVTNTSGKVLPVMTTLALTHESDSLHVGIGAKYTLDAMHSLSTQSRGPLRPMSMMQTVSGWVKDPSDLPSDTCIKEANVFIKYPGATFDPVNKYRIPSPEALGRLSMETGNPLWVSLWVMATDDTLDEFFRRLALTYPLTLDLYVEGGNEVWNNSYTANSGFLAKEYGKPEHEGTGLFEDGTGKPTMHNSAHLTLRVIRAARKVFGDRAKGRYNGQLGWPDRSMMALDYIDPGIVQAGQPLGKIIDSPCVAAYFALASDDLSTANGHSGAPNTGRGIAGFDTWNISFPRRQILESGAWKGAAGASWLERANKNGIDDAAQYVATWQTKLAAKGYKPLRSIYEGTQSHNDVQTFGYQDYVNGKPTSAAYLFAFDPTTGSFTLSDGLPTGLTLPKGGTFTDSQKSLDALFSDGDLAQFGYYGTTGLIANKTYPVRKIGGVMYAYANGAAYASGTPLTTTGTLGKLLVANITRVADYHRTSLALLWANMSADGTGELVMDYWHRKMVAAGITESATFQLAGGATCPLNDYSAARPWAFKPGGFWAPNTPAVDWVRTKT
jgi:hypothetical protein